MFYLWLNESQLGPYDQDHLVDWITQNPENKDTLCWTQGMPEWKPIGEIFAEAQASIDEDESIWCDQEYLDKIVDVSSKVSKKAGKTLNFFYNVAADKLNTELTNRSLRKVFNKAAADGVITAHEEADILAVIENKQIKWGEACEVLSPQARSFIKEVLANAISDGVVTETEQTELLRYIELFRLEDMRSEIMSVIRNTNALHHKKIILPKIFEEAAEDGVITSAEEANIRKILNEQNIPWDEACSVIGQRTRSFVREVLADAISDGVVTEEEKKELIRYIKLFGIEDLEYEVMSVIRRTNVIHNLEKGILTQPLPSSPIWLRSGEAIYFESPASFIKEVRNEEIEIDGTLFVTNTRIEFISAENSVSKILSCIRSCEANCRSTLELSFNPINGSGLYLMEDAQMAEAYILALTKSSNRTGSLSYESCSVSERRKITKEVRHSVWIRDAGKCVDCGADDYLEYDHIIPVSKGGSNTTNNIQLLCRRCNGKKSNRI
jgi:citrate lyase gamma subunit